MQFSMSRRTCLIKLSTIAHRNINLTSIADDFTSASLIDFLLLRRVIIFKFVKSEGLKKTYMNEVDTDAKESHDIFEDEHFISYIICLNDS